MKLIAGLGNPGTRYDNTRHNLGFRALDALAAALNVLFTRVQDNAAVVRAHYAGGNVLLVKPMTFMNRSGLSVAALARRNGCVPEDVLVVVDDVNLPIGKIRLRAGGSAGGHNGLKSIAAELGSKDFHRLRMGVAPETPPPGDLSAFVLGRFASEERVSARDMADEAAAAALCWLEEGIERAMSRHN